MVRGSAFKDGLLATSPVRHDECADLLKDDCAFLRQGFFRATVREWQVPVCLNRESSTGSFDSQNRIPVSVVCFFQFHLTGYRVRGSGFSFQRLGYAFQSTKGTPAL